MNALVDMEHGYVEAHTKGLERVIRFIWISLLLELQKT